MTHNTGLSQADIDAIKTAISSCPKVDQGLLFGSRAKGTYRNGSDVDLALKGRELSFRDISRISELLNEETSMPYRFDVLDYDRISEAKLKNHIDRNAISIYSKTPDAQKDSEERQAR
jgi:predicted nucleotidyltransferase